MHVGCHPRAALCTADLRWARFPYNYVLDTFCRFSSSSSFWAASRTLLPALRPLCMCCALIGAPLCLVFAAAHTGTDAQAAIQRCFLITAFRLTRPAQRDPATVSACLRSCLLTLYFSMKRSAAQPP